MRKKMLVGLGLIGCLGVSTNAHDLFLKFETYILKPDSRTTVWLMNGTFGKSDATVAFDRLQDASVLTPDRQALHVRSADFRNEGTTSSVDLRTAQPGTYVIGISTKPREITLKATDFNRYLQHDGIPDILAARRKSGESNRDARERYSKHAKAIFQVGDIRTEGFKTSFHYPVEIIPQQNPYSLKVGQSLEVQCLMNGTPIANQFVIAGWEPNHGERSPLTMRTDPNGIARITLKEGGKWYVKMIYMLPVKDPNINYESKWATLTFEIK